ncbi:unnamed protein product, partial [marine sediment metagenome]
VLNYHPHPLLNDQSDHACPTGILLAYFTKWRVYHLVTDNAKKSNPSKSIATSAPPILKGNSFTALSIDETRLRNSQSTLPEYDAEVVS